ncbi:ribonuclease III domain-containing protein [Diaporthe sp. PMI_573]|nr:ribonuclease III domain-containing protein [Diaporthaceae sp. PMI_573]
MDKASKLELAQEILGYEFKDPSLLWEALQAPSSGVVSHAGRMYTNEGHKPLAGIGDTILSLYIKDRARNHRQTVGVATDNLKAMANNHRLTEICDANELTGYISGNPAQQGAVSPRIKSDTVEAVLGAIYKDGNDNMEPVKAVMLRLGIILVTLYTSPVHPGIEMSIHKPPVWITCDSSRAAGLRYPRDPPARAPS